MKELKKDILEIIPKIAYEDDENEESFFNAAEKSMRELFKDFYIKQRMVEPTEEIMELFLNIVEGEEDEEDEA